MFDTMVMEELHAKYPGRQVRQVMSAIRPFFEDPQVLVGKQICVVTNLEPRKFRGYESQGMILAVGDKETGVTFIGPENPVIPGVKLF
jgi:methionyl-tRNA synthetase